MGIQNIQILINPHGPIIKIDQARQVAEAHFQALVDAHCRGEHPYGSMRRDCLLCQSA